MAGVAAEASYADRVSCEAPDLHVRVIRFDRTEKKNALHSSMIIEMARLLDEAAADPQVRCVILAGAEECFAAGSDLKEMLDSGPAAFVNNPRRVDAWRRFEQFPKPLIAAVNGIAFGAGCEIAMACDFIVAGENARFAQPEVGRGGMAGDGGTQRLPRKVGPGLASYMLMTGEPIDAARALSAGLVVEVCEPSRTVARALEIARLIAEKAPKSVQFTKACIRVAVGATLENGLAFERDCLWRNSATEDRYEGLRAFEEKRPPVFTGR